MSPRKPTEIRGEDIFLDPTPPTEMLEDRLDKRLNELESAICVALVLHLRAGRQVVPADLLPAIEHYGQLWDEAWTR